jgi:hypothetical protein
VGAAAVLYLAILPRLRFVCAGWEGRQWGVGFWARWVPEVHYFELRLSGTRRIYVCNSQGHVIFFPIWGNRFWISSVKCVRFRGERSLQDDGTCACEVYGLELFHSCGKGLTRRSAFPVMPPHLPPSSAVCSRSSSSQRGTRPGTRTA